MCAGFLALHQQPVVFDTELTCKYWLFIIGKCLPEPAAEEQRAPFFCSQASLGHSSTYKYLSCQLVFFNFKQPVPPLMGFDVLAFLKKIQILFWHFQLSLYLFFIKIDEWTTLREGRPFFHQFLPSLIASLANFQMFLSVLNFNKVQAPVFSIKWAI